MRTVDVNDEVADREDAVLSDAIDADQLTHQEELAVTLADHVAPNHLIIDRFVGALREAFGEAETVELLLFTSLEVGLDWFCIALELDTTDASSYPSDLNYPHEV